MILNTDDMISNCADAIPNTMLRYPRMPKTEDMISRTSAGIHNSDDMMLNSKDLNYDRARIHKMF
jgi:hypothetical protein